MTDDAQRLRVLHLIEGLGSGGAERLLYTNLKHLGPDRVESVVMTVFSGPSFWKGPIEELGVPVRSLECGSLRNVAAGVWRLRRHIREIKPDLIHTHLWAANVIGRVVGRLAGVPVISSIHNPEYEPAVFTDSARLNKRKLKVALQADKQTARFGCSRMIAVSKYLKDSTVERLGYAGTEIDVLYNPVEFEGLPVCVDRRDQIRERIGVPAGSAVLLNVGRVSPQKGLVHLVRAMPKILKIFPTARLVSVGCRNDPDYLLSVENEIYKLGIVGSVHLLGERRDVQDLLRACDVFVFPSLFEGLGIALAEAMAAECACVINDIRPLNEFVVDGFNGVLVPPREPDKLAEAIIDLLRNSEKSKALGAAAKETALRLFQPHPAAERLTEIYMSVAGR